MEQFHITFTQFMQGFPGPGKPKSTIAGSLKAIAIMARSGVDEFFRNRVGPDGVPWKPIRPRPDGSDVPLRDTGRLYNSIKGKVENGQIVLQASHPAAAVHQFGATIRPVIAKALSIPLTKEAKRAGSPRRMRGLFLYKSPGQRNAFLARREPQRDANARLVLHYILRKEVKIPARPYLGYSDATIAKIQKFLADRMAAALVDPLKGI